MRCDRDWPTCKRCRKREEKCEYDEDVTVCVALVVAAGRELMLAAGTTRS